MYDSTNTIVGLCVQGMNVEAEGKTEEALALFQQAWQEAANDLEKFTAAHYVARHQKTIEDKLTWDKTALTLALKIDNEPIKSALPSLYLNVAKGYEDLNNPRKARDHYELAHAFTGFLADDGYGTMIKSGIARGLQRISDSLPINPVE